MISQMVMFTEKKSIWNLPEHLNEEAEMT